MRKFIFRSFILALIMALGFVPAHASLVSWNVFAVHAGGPDDTDFNITFFLDSADIPTTGTAMVQFSSFEVIFNGPVTGNVDISHTYSNTDVSACDFFCNFSNYVPVHANINTAGAIVGVISGIQPGGGVTGLRRVDFHNNVPLGQVIRATFSASAATKGNTEQDFGDFGTITFVPIPAAVWLFGSGLGLLGWMKRKRA